MHTGVLIFDVSHTPLPLLLCSVQLILDEPTNHLDAAAKKWIAGYLSGYEGSVLIVSHDEALMEAATTSVAEVRNKKLELYKSRSYKQWQVSAVVFE